MLAAIHARWRLIRLAGERLGKRNREVTDLDADRRGLHRVSIVRHGRCRQCTDPGGCAVPRVADVRRGHAARHRHAADDAAICGKVDTRKRVPVNCSLRRHHHRLPGSVCGPGEWRGQDNGGAATTVTWTGADVTAPPA